MTNQQTPAKMAFLEIDQNPNDVAETSVVEFRGLCTVQFARTLVLLVDGYNEGLIRFDASASGGLVR